MQASVFASATLPASPVEVELDGEEQLVAAVMRAHRVPGADVGFVTRAGRVPD